MKHHRSYPDHSPSSSQGSQEAFADVADREGNSTPTADRRKHEKKKNRSPCPVSGSDGLDVDEAAPTGAWTGEKKTKIQSGDPGRIARDGDVQSDEDCLKQIEGYDWDDSRLTEATDWYVKQLNNGPPDYDKLEILYEQVEELMKRIACYRIRAYTKFKGKEMDEDQLTDPVTLRAEGYYKWCEREFEWYFDEGFPHYVGLQDYQRLMLRNNLGEYGDDELESFCKLRCTLEGDQQYVQFWEKLSNDTKWFEKAFRCSQHVWEKVDRLVFYQAVKIAADFPMIYSTLIFSGFTEYKWSVQYDVTYYQGYAWLYFEIWKRVAKKKMNLKEALGEVSVGDVPIACFAQIKWELNNSNPEIRGPVTHNYETYVAHISGALEECDARPLIMEAVKIFVRRPKIYYDFAKKKLDIAKTIGSR